MNHNNKLFNSLQTISCYKTIHEQLHHQKKHSIFFNNQIDHINNYFHYYYNTNQTQPQLNHLHSNHQSIINSFQSLYQLTNSGKLILGCQDIIQLLVQLSSKSISHLLSTCSILIKHHLLIIPQNFIHQPSFLRFPQAPFSQILHHSTSLLIQIIKFSSPQLSTAQVKLIIDLFINKIGLVTCFESHLKIVLDYIDCLIIFGYVPTRLTPTISTTPSPSDHLDGESLLIDLVRFVARIVALENLDGTVNVVNLQELDPDLLDPSPSDLTNPFRLVVESSTSLSPTIIQQAKTCMKDLIRSPANQAIKSLLSTLAADDPAIDECSKIGAIRCLRYAFEDYDQIYNQTRPVAASMDEEASGVATSLTLLGLGLLLVKPPLTEMILSPRRTSLAIDYEILMLLYDRLQFRLQPNTKTSMIANLMKEDDLDCCLDLLLLFAQERLKIWINQPESDAFDWYIDSNLEEKEKDLNAPSSPPENPTNVDEPKKSPLVPFGKLFLLLFTQHASEIQLAADLEDKMSETLSLNMIDLDKYYSLCIALSSYLSNPLKISLINQIEYDQVCSPESSSWLSNLILLSDAFFQFDLAGQSRSTKPTPKSCCALHLSPSTVDSQVRLVRLIHDIYMEIRDLDEWKDELLQQVVIPTLSRFLLLPELRSFDDPVLIDLVMNFIREITHNELVNQLLGNQDRVEGGTQDLTGMSSDTYDRLRKLLVTTARIGQLIDVDEINQLTKSSIQQPNRDSIQPFANDVVANPNLSNTPLSTPSTLPLKAPTTTSTTISNTIFSPHRLSTRNSDQIPISQRSDAAFAKRQNWLSYKAVVTLVKLFVDALKLSTGYSNAKCASIFVDLLSLLRPENALMNSSNPHNNLAHSLRLSDFDHDLQPTKNDETQIDNRTRLAILKCLLRLRADEEHRIQFVRDLEIDGLAQIIGRVIDPSQSNTTGLASPDKKSGIGSITSSQKPRNVTFTRDNYERGGARMSRRSISTSSNATVTFGMPYLNNASDTVDDDTPLWTVPENLDEFEWEPKIETQSTHCLVTHDHPVRKDRDPSGDHLSQKNNPNSTHHRHLIHHMTVLPIADYLAVLIAILRYEVDWELVSYVLCHLPGQLSNKHFTCESRASQQIHQLRRFLCNGIKTDTLLHQVRFPLRQRVKLTDAHAISYQTLSTLIAYKALFDKSQADEMVGAFVKGLSKYKDTSKACIHALSLACHELQPSITKFLPEILRGLTKIVSSAFVSVHILELLGFLGQIPSLYANLTEEEFKMIFGIALQYITTHNQLQKLEDSKTIHGSTQHLTPSKLGTVEPSFAEEVELAFQQYVYLMAFYIIAVWFVSLKLPERKKYISFITRKLVQACEGKQQLDEPTEVCFDMLNRYTYSNAEPKPRMKQSTFNQVINSSLGKPIRTTSWLIGDSILTIKCLSRPGWAEVCVRRPSGMVKMIWELENLSGDYGASEQDVLDMIIRHRDTLNCADSDENDSINNPTSIQTQDIHDGGKSNENLLASSNMTQIREINLESVLGQSEEITRTTGIEPNYTNLSVEPSFFALQLFPFGDFGGSGLGDVRSNLRPIKVPDQPAFQRAVEMIDYLPVVDFHKIGVIYVGPGQTTEEEILGNREGSKAYISFLSSLGQLVRLKGCEHYNTGGLDSKNDSNGKFAYMWGDDITQICFHIATLMPTNREEQPTGPDPILAKKSLIGNDFVVIVYNDSGKEYKFDCLKSQFNFINIIIEPNTPINSTLNLHAGVQQELKFFKISLQRKQGLPKIGPIGENFKMISSSCVSEFTRRLSLHCNTFSQVYLACVGTETKNSSNTNQVQIQQHPLDNSQQDQNQNSNRSKLEYVSHWRARLREIKRFRERIIKSQSTTITSTSTNNNNNNIGSNTSEDSSSKLTQSTSTTPTTSSIPSNLKSSASMGSHHQQQQQRSASSNQMDFIHSNDIHHHNLNSSTNHSFDDLSVGFTGNSFSNNISFDVDLLAQNLDFSSWTQ